MDVDTHNTLEAISNAQRDMLAMQRETLEFMRAEAAKAQRIREDAIAMQRQAVARARRLSYLVLPLIAGCLFLLVRLITKYGIL